MTRPRIYGNESRCRSTIARSIEKAEDLLDQAIGVRKQYEAALERWDRDEPRREKERREREEREAVARQSDPFSRPLLRLEPRKPTFRTVAEVAGWDAEFGRWVSNVDRKMRSHLQEQFRDVLPVLWRGAPTRWDPEPEEEADEWLERAVAELRELQSVLGVRRNIETAPPAATPFGELGRSGLVDEQVISDHARNMAAPRTPKQLLDAVGSAKELTEATLRGALDQLGVRYQSRDNLAELMKAWRIAIVKPAAPSRGGIDPLAKIVNAHVAFLSDWRNLYGRGHGRTRYTAGVRPRHAWLARDAAETVIRFIVATMDDLELLPP